MSSFQPGLTTIATPPYCGAPALPEDFWLRWNLDPWLIAGLIALAAAHGWAVAHRRGFGHGRGECFLAGWGLAALVFVSPFCALASALFAARAGHHMLLIAVIPPLLLLATPPRRRMPGGAAALAALAVGHAIVLWFWHVPAAYAAALADTRIYWLMQATLFGSALLLWRTVLAPTTHAGSALAALAGTLMQTALLGTVLTFARAPLYAFHHTTTWPWGFSPLADQQLAGALMWVLGAFPYLVAILALLATRILRPAAAPDLAR